MLKLTYSLNIFGLIASLSQFTQAATPALTYLKEQGIHLEMVDPNHRGPIPIELAGRIQNFSENPALVPGTVSVYNRPILEVLKSVQDQHGEVAMDCLLFVQIAALLRDPESSRYVLFSAVRFNPSHLKELFQDVFGYVHPTDPKAHVQLQNMSFMNKGQWVIRENENTFTGLVRGGPITASKEEWLTRTKSDLFTELEGRMAGSCIFETRLPDVRTIEFRKNVENNLLWIMRELKELDDWQMTL